MRHGRSWPNKGADNNCSAQLAGRGPRNGLHPKRRRAAFLAECETWDLRLSMSCTP